ncbi:MAG: hypothetical protein KAV00_12580, partial [Phycisphaerae bacterium]|nr:hypothetical protein [Phycisphaerae bacterium]
ADSDCSCTAGDDCVSNLCIAGHCRQSCSVTYNGNQCSNGSNAYTAYGICTSQTGTGWSCDSSVSAYNDTYYLYDCADSSSSFGEECDSDSLSGGYVIDGVCGGSTHSTCYTDYASDATSSISASSVFGTTTTVCNDPVEDGDYCDAISDGSFVPGTQRCDANDSYCDACDAGTIGDDGNCEVSCGADAVCDEQSAEDYCPTDSTWCSSICAEVDRDTSQAACIDTGTGCTVHEWNTGGSQCCGDDGATTEDWDDGNYNGATQCCLNGDLENNNTVTNSNYYCYDDGAGADIYRCNGTDTTGDVDTESSDCIHVGLKYCDLDNNEWIDSIPAGCTGCTYGTDCGSGLCIDGSCQSSCSSSYNGNQCSNGSTAYTADGICTLNSTGWSCDKVKSAYNGTYYLYDCSHTSSDYGDQCDSDSLSGGYVIDGVCGGTSHNTCYTDYASDATSSISASSVFGTTTTVCNDPVEDGDYCDDVSDGSFVPGTQRCDANDSYCDACDAGNIGDDGNCEVSCGAAATCDEYGTLTCPTDSYICTATCAYTDRDTLESYCTDSTGCNAYTWNPGASQCCGDDGATTEDWDDGDYNGATQCCLNGTLQNNNTVLGDYYYCYD